MLPELDKEELISNCKVNTVDALGPEGGKV